MPMTDTSTRAPEFEPEPQYDPTQPGAADSAAEAQAAAAAPEPDPMEQLAREAADLKDRLLRSLAEMENIRRRNERDVADARAYGISAFARDLLAVADNMRRALDVVATELHDNSDPGIKALIAGVELTERELLNALEKHGVKQLDPRGSKFDPHRHQAMFEVPDASVPAGTVVQVVQPGYTIGERVLRPAMVAVAKGGPKFSAVEPAAAAQDSASANESANDNSAGPR